MDDAIREHHGCACRDKVTHAPRIASVFEDGDLILARMDDVYLTEWQARYMAAKLYRLARRIRDRRQSNNT